MTIPPKPYVKPLPVEDRVDYLIEVQCQVADIRHMAVTAASVRAAQFLYTLADDLEAETRAEDLVLCSPE
jgi:hypothetical protein